jgi:uncharacterized membrane protein/Mg-chelatase subunit ChlD
MFGLRIGFNQPYYLLLLALLPVLWWFSYRSLAGLGRWRRLIAIGLRSAVLLILVLCLAEVQLLRVSNRVTVLYLLDQSESIPKLVRDGMLDYVTTEVRKHRQTGISGEGGDKAGVIIFGREATIELPPFADEIRSVGLLESLFQLRTDATNISSALKLAQASFPEDTAKRVVIVTDGNENLGDARTIARSLADNGIGIDVVPISLKAREEIAIEKIQLPTDIRLGQPLEGRVVVSNFTQPTEDNPKGIVKGRIKLSRKYAQQEEPLDAGEFPVELQPGKNVFPFKDTIDVPAGYTYRADFIPDDPKQDLITQNNTATAFSYVRGKGRVLLITDWESPNEFRTLIKALGDSMIEVDEMPSNRLFTSLGELQAYDCVVLGNVPRASGGVVEDPNATSSFSDDQITMLVRNTEQFGCGLVMLGGPASFGAGGWTNTELEKAMPVDFQIKNSKVRAVGALVMMLHASELAQGNHWQKVIAEEALKVLGPQDFCGTLAWDDRIGRDNWLWGQPKGLVQVGSRQKMMMAAISRMIPGDMPDFDPMLKKAIAALAPNQASVKHSIIISDGDPTPSTPSVLQQFKKAGVKISTVAVGTHGPAGSQELQKIAANTGGKYYVVTNPNALPRIFQIEARKVARPLIYDAPDGIAPKVVYDHEIVQNLDTQTLPPITGYVMTQVKENPLVEVSIAAPKPDNFGPNSTILASWTYGSGRSVAFTTDTGTRWAKSWADWEGYDKLMTQIIRWAMRPVNEEGKFTVATDVKDGKVRVIVTALDKNDEFLNFLQMSAAGSAPDLSTLNINMRQEAPGRYVGELAADKAGSYLIAINPGKGHGTLLTGVTVPYSAEYRDREPNQGLLTTLASVKPKGGQPGELIQGDVIKGNVEHLTSVDTFRRTLEKAVSTQDVWPFFLLVAAVLFLGDVFVRRVQVGFEWMTPAVAWVRQRILGRPSTEEERDERLERLRNRKAALGQQMDERRAGARFEPTPDANLPARDIGDAIEQAQGGPSVQSQTPQRPAASNVPQTEQETYTERLLAAKKKAQKDQGG